MEVRNEVKMDVAGIDAIVQGQVERNVKENTNCIYMSKCSVMTSMINKAFELNEDGNALMHNGKAKAIHKLQLPIDVATAKRIFALISVDEELPKKKRRTTRTIDEVSTAEDDSQILTERQLNHGKTRVTVTAQTYQNYKSALRWWHQYDSPQLDKVGYIWPPEVDRVLACAIATYKRDIGIKKRDGVKSNKEGKANLACMGT